MAHLLLLIAVLTSAGPVPPAVSPVGVLLNPHTKQHVPLKQLNGPPSNNPLLGQSVIPTPNLPSVTTGALTQSPQTPQSLKSAYSWSTSPSAGTGQTIAIVDLYHNPYTEAQLGVFSAQYGLPNCTVANKCLTIVNNVSPSTGANSGWFLEAALDIQWAHAVAPGAKKILVECDPSSDIFGCVSQAASLASYVSMSFTITENLSYSSYFKSTNTMFQSHATTSFFASSGDAGAQVNFPASSPIVVAVGGTGLYQSGSTITEQGWSGSGGGCSTVFTWSSAQSSYPGTKLTAKGCSGTQRKVPDLSLDANPNSGGYVYLQYSTGVNTTSAGWYVVGGTSLSSPSIASHFATKNVTSNPTNIYGPNAAFSFRDITTGNNGYACTKGYDLVTGVGSPIS